VLQLESAMGAAIGSFPGARLLCVPRDRFVPVKTTDDLLLLRSDAYVMDEYFRLAPNTDPTHPDGRLPFVELDPRHYKLIDDFERRIPEGPPSLREAERLVVHGDVTFRRGVVIRGAVEIDAQAPRVIEPGTVLDGA
jgi:UTP--glucose-1-phosphate uridylyltransferase